MKCRSRSAPSSRTGWAMPCRRSQESQEHRAQDARLTASPERRAAACCRLGRIRDTLESETNLVARRRRFSSLGISAKSSWSSTVMVRSWRSNDGSLSLAAIVP